MSCGRCGHPEERHNALTGCLAPGCACGSFDLAAEAAGGDRVRRSQADRLVELGLAAELFCDPRGAAFAAVRSGGHTEHHPVRGRGFRRWLAGRFYEATGGKAPNAEALGAALLVLEARAQFDGAPKRPVHLRVAPDGRGGVYIDLGDETWEAVHVAPDGWRIVSDPPVAFRRPPGLGAMPRPETGGSLEELRDLLNVGSADDWVLIEAWLAQALYPRGPYPVLALGGEQGAAKSTAARMLRALVDPSAPGLRADPREVRDLMVAAENAWVLAFDNVSRIQPWLSDALCRLSTGGGWATRELYSDSDEVLFEATRPVILNGIAEFITRGDLLDRAIQITLPPIPEHARRREEEVWSGFERARPRLLGALLDRLAGALREREQVRLERLPRMADFAVLAVAAERGAGEEPRFLPAYAGARAEADQAAVEGSPVGPALLAWVRATALPWEGTAAELLSGLERAVEERERPRGWPRTPRGLRAELDRLAPSLRRLGLGVSSERRGHERSRVLRIRAEKEGAEPSAPSASAADGHLPAAPARTVGEGRPSATVRNRPRPGANHPAPELGGRGAADDAVGADGLAAASSEDGLPPEARAIIEALRTSGEPLSVPEIARRTGLTWVRALEVLEGPLAGRVGWDWMDSVQRWFLAEVVEPWSG